MSSFIFDKTERIFLSKESKQANYLINKIKTLIILFLKIIEVKLSVLVKGHAKNRDDDAGAIRGFLNIRKTGNGSGSKET
jgi:hypothetical protein